MADPSTNSYAVSTETHAGGCVSPGCGYPVTGGRRHCEAHKKRLQRLRKRFGEEAADGLARDMAAPVGEHIENPFERVMIAMAAFLDADSRDDAEYERRKELLRKAMNRLYLTKGWTPPPPGRARWPEKRN